MTHFFSTQRNTNMTCHGHFTRILFALSLTLATSACGDDNATPSDDGDNVIDLPDAGPEPAGGSGGSGGEGGGDGGPGGAGGTGGDSGTGGTGGVEPLIDAGTLGLPDCTDTPNGTQGSTPCWDLSACNGQDTTQFLEQCSDHCLAPFNNTTRIEGYTGGALPPLN